jgi:hypothetical protein
LLRNLSLYLAWALVLMLAGSMSLAWLVMALLGPVASAAPELAPYTAALAYAVTALVALAIPAQRWQTQGLLPEPFAAEKKARLAFGERTVAIGHGLLFIGTVAPLGALILLQDSEYAFMAFYAATFLTLPVCVVLWIVGLYNVHKAGSWP